MEAISKGEIYRFGSKPWIREGFKVTISQCLEHYSLWQQNRLMMKEI